MTQLTKKYRPLLGTVTETTLPDESDKELAELRQSLLEELAPRSAYAASIATDIAHAIWDIQRHRRIMAAAISSAVRDNADNILRTREQREREDGPSIGRRLLKWDPEALEELEDKGLTLGDLTAAAFDSRSETVAYHESRISDLERRRDRLFESFNRVQDLRKPSDIEDAEEVD